MLKKPSERIERMKMMREQGDSLDTIGTVFGVSRARVHQLLGNTGTVKTDRLRAKANYWADQVYGKESITLKALALKFKIHPETAEDIIGTHLAYQARIGKRRCSFCKKWKPFDQFYLLYSDPTPAPSHPWNVKTNLASRCKPCADTQATLYRKSKSKKGDW